MDNKWILDRLLELARLDARSDERITSLESQREANTAAGLTRWPNFWQFVAAAGSIAAVLIALFKH